MKIPGTNLELARSKPKVDTEVGSGQAVRSLFTGEVIDTNKIKIKDLIAMRKQDGTARAIYSILTMPILSNPYTIEPADDSAEAKKQADFVNECLTLPPHQGGMSTPFHLVIADMLRAVLEGWRGYEKVFTLRDGKVVYSKIAPRDNQITTIMQDDRGGFNGLRQYAYIGQSYKMVTIPVQYSFVFTFGKENHPLYGESAFLSAFYHYDKKHRLYYLGNQAAQQFAIPPKKVTAPANAKQESLDTVVDAVGALSTNSTVGLPAGFEADTLTAAGKFDVMPLIDHHNAEMARSVMAHFMMLGTGSEGGSWALSKDQTDMFVLALRSVMHSIEEHINSYIIPDLIEYNFEKPLYPSFDFADITEQTQSLLKEISMTVMEKRPEGIPDWLIQELMAKLSAHLGIDVPKVSKADKTTADTAMSRKPHRAHKLAEGKWFRPLTPAEKKVNFAGIQRKYTQLEQDFVNAAKPTWDTITADTIKALRKLLEKKDYKALDSFEIPGLDSYRKVLIEQMMEAYNYAKNGAADEMERKAPATKNTTRDLIKQQAQAIVDKQTAELLFQVRNLVNTALRKNQLSMDLSIGDVLSAFGTFMSGYFSDKVGLGGATGIAIAVNAGRDDVFTTYRDTISKYQYSAILDELTCDICADLDGSIVDESEYRETDWMPPIHLNCRCLWVEIMEVETDQPEITGIPDTPGGVGMPMLSADRQEARQTLADSHKHDELAQEAVGRVIDNLLLETAEDGRK